MAFDLTRSYWEDSKEYSLADGSTVSEEGVLMSFVAAGTGVAVSPCTGGAAERVAGWAITDAKKVTTWVNVETVTVPAGGGTVQLQSSNLVAASTYAYNNTAAAAMTVVGGAPASGQVQINTANGTATFNVAQAGANVTVQYRYNLTLQEIYARFHERSVNNRAQDYFGLQSVAKGEGEFFTTMFDSSVAYAIGATVYTEAGGLVTSAAGGTAVGFVIRAPEAGYGYLGVKFNLGGV